MNKEESDRWARREQGGFVWPPSPSVDPAKTIHERKRDFQNMGLDHTGAGAYMSGGSDADSEKEKTIFLLTLEVDALTLAALEKEYDVYDVRVKGRKTHRG